MKLDQLLLHGATNSNPLSTIGVKVLLFFTTSNDLNIAQHYKLKVVIGAEVSPILGSVADLHTSVFKCRNIKVTFRLIPFYKLHS